MSSRLRWLIVGFALAGLGLASASAWVHYRVLTDPTYVSPCDLNTTFSCTQVYLSRFGSVAGVPVALGGVFWFGLVALVAGFARPAGRDSAAAGYLFALATIGLAVVLYLGYASFVVLHAGCLLCMGAYVCAVAIFGLAATTRGVPVGRLPLRVLADLRAAVGRPVALTIAVLYLAGVVSAVAMFPREGEAVDQSAAAAPVSADARRNFADAWARQPRVDLGIPADGAAIVIVKFNDYECPACREAEQYYQPVLEKFDQEHPGAVKYVLKDWPWNSTCNFNATATIHGHEASCYAAAAARMAKARGKYDAMADWLYGHQDTTPAAVREAAGQILGITDFDKEYALELPAIRRDIADGGVLRIESTPTFFINGVRLPAGIIPPQYFELALNLELKKAG